MSIRNARLRTIINSLYLNSVIVNNRREDGIMESFIDERMQEMISKGKSCTICMLRKTSKRDEPGADKIVREHGKRNFEPRADGKLPIVCPVTDGSEVSGIGIFNLIVEETKKLMDEDPGIKAGLFTYELHACRGFPGSALA
jgi:hypothetical protein